MTKEVQEPARSSAPSPPPLYHDKRVQTSFLGAVVKRTRGRHEH